MAKKNTAESREEQMPEETGLSESHGGFDAPPELGDDFQDVTAERSDGWYEPEQGSWFLGHLVGRYEMSQVNEQTGKRRAFYQVRVRNASANMTTGKKSEGTQQTERVEAGDLLAFDERKAMEALRPYAESDGAFEVLIECLGKKPVPGTTRSWWDFKVRAKTKRAPKTPIRSRDASQDDIPF